MPISSGAAGRVTVGINTTIARPPDGVKRGAKPVSRNNDSYLTRYLESRKYVKDKCESKQNASFPSEALIDNGNMETNDENTKARQSNDEDNSDKSMKDNVTSRENSIRSKTCILL